MSSSKDAPLVAPNALSNRTPKSKTLDPRDVPTTQIEDRPDEIKVLMRFFDKENRTIIMPVISGDQYAAFKAYTKSMLKFYDPEGTNDDFAFFREFIPAYEDALTAEGGYFGDLMVKLLAALKTTETKGGEGLSGVRRFFFGNR